MPLLIHFNAIQNHDNMNAFLLINISKLFNNLSRLELNLSFHVTFLYLYDICKYESMY